jgi:GDPmannose 4,6-dehydratase
LTSFIYPLNCLNAFILRLSFFRKMCIEVQLRKIALITGVGGQDGSYLSEFLLSKGYIVHGLLRHSSVDNKQRIRHLIDIPDFHLHYGDMTQSIAGLIKQIKPTEIYNLAAQSFVKASFDMPRYTCDSNATSVTELLEAVRAIDPSIKIYQASTSELYGNSPPPQNEDTRFQPRSPYAISKLCSYWMMRNYREAYRIFAVNGILFNHESPRRGDMFVTKKICKGVADIVRKKLDYIELGNLNALRDWGHARDYVICMWQMLQQPEPDDFVISTGYTWSVRQFVEEAFKNVNIHISWTGEGVDEVGIDQNGVIRVKVNAVYFRPTEVEALHGDSSKAQRILNWHPTTTFEEMVSEMVSSELESN